MLLPDKCTPRADDSPTEASPRRAQPTNTPCRPTGDEGSGSTCAAQPSSCRLRVSPLASCSTLITGISRLAHAPGSATGGSPSAPPDRRPHPPRGRVVWTVVNECRHAVGRQACRHQLPEGFEPDGRHMRQPEGEEHRLVAAPGPPVEYVGADHFHAVGGTTGESLARERHHLRSRIDGSHEARRLGKPCGPLAGTAGDLQQV